MSVTPCIYKDRLWGDPMSHPFIEGRPYRTHGNHDWQQNARHDVDHSNLLPAAGSVSRKVSRKPPYNTHTHKKKKDPGGFGWEEHQWKQKACWKNVICIIYIDNYTCIVCSSWKKSIDTFYYTILEFLIYYTSIWWSYPKLQNCLVWSRIQNHKWSSEKRKKHPSATRCNAWNLQFWWGNSGPLKL